MTVPNPGAAITVASRRFTTSPCGALCGLKQNYRRSVGLTRPATDEFVCEYMSAALEHELDVQR
jgi:hypothetical protein